MNIYERVFLLLNYAWYILFVLAYFNIWSPANTYLKIVTFYFKTLVACIIIYFFNPYNKTKCNEVHRSIIFTAGTFLLFSEGLMSNFDNIFADTRTLIKNFIII
jgi:hypothetical protein